jgi:uncharacterized membrane protein
MMGVPSESDTQKLAVAVELHVNVPSGFTVNWALAAAAEAAMIAVVYFILRRIY